MKKTICILLALITVIAVCLSMASCACSEKKPADSSHEGTGNGKEETPIDVPPANDSGEGSDDQNEETHIDAPPTDDPDEGLDERGEEIPEKEYSIKLSQLDVSLSDFYGSVLYAKGKYLLHDLSMYAVYDQAKGTETELPIKMPDYYSFDGENVYYSYYVDSSLAAVDSYDLHRFNIKDFSDKVIYTVPEGFENLLGVKCAGRYLAWTEKFPSSKRVLIRVMNLDTSEIIYDTEAYTTLYVDPGLSEEGLLFFMTRDGDEYTYHVVDITTTQEIWKKEHMQYPLSGGQSNGKYVAYSYNKDSDGNERAFYVESVESGEAVYSAGNVRSALFINDCLVTGLPGGFRITDLNTGKKIANTADFEELYGANYLYDGWIEKAEDNQFIIIRENMERVAKDDPLKGRWAQEIFVVTLDELV